jgi:2'-5' RNA ligase
MIRLFVAVNLDESLRHAVAEVEQRLKATNADVKWVRAESLHITLKFLGWVQENRVPEIEQAIAQAVEEQAPFRLSLAGLGGFPTPTAPRVVWVGIEAGAAELASLAERMEQAMKPLGFEREEREFSAHVTIGRSRGAAGREQLVAALQAERERRFGEMQVARVELMRSDLRPTGPIYISQRAFEL